MNKVIFIVILTITVSGFSLKADAKRVFCNFADTSKIKGLEIQINRYSKRTAILMRDTTLSGNRFYYNWYRAAESNKRLSLDDYLFPAFLVDSAMAAYCDSLFLFDPNNTSIKLTGWPKRSLKKLLRKYLRLYIGFIDDEGRVNVVVQFASLRDFKKYKMIYDYELFLVVPRKELHFVVLNMGHSQ